MKYATFNPDGSIAQACNDDTVAELPGGALSMTGEQFANWPTYRRSEDGLSLMLADPVPPVPPTKDEQIAYILATQGKGRDRTTIQLSIQLAELIATLQAPAYGMTVPQAIAYAYSKNPTYRQSKDAEAAIRAVELAP